MEWMAHFISVLFFFIFFYFCLFRVIPVTYGDSQARGQIGSVATSLHQNHSRATATQDPSHTSDLHHSSWQCQILNTERGRGSNLSPQGCQLVLITDEPRWQLLLYVLESFYVFTVWFFFFPCMAIPVAYRIPGLGVELELHHSHSYARSEPHCKLHLTLRQHQTLNTLRDARDRTHILVDTSRVLNPLSHNRNPQIHISSLSFENIPIISSIKISDFLPHPPQ